METFIMATRRMDYFHKYDYTNDRSVYGSPSDSIKRIKKDNEVYPSALEKERQDFLNRLSIEEKSKQQKVKTPYERRDLRLLL